MNLKHKVALVTGASRGIGEAIALALANAGVKLFLTGRDEARLQRVAEHARQAQAEAAEFVADLRDEAQIKQLLARAIQQFGQLDILVNNAGLGYFRPVAEMATAEWDEMFAINLRAAFLATREALPHLRQAGESFIVNVASLAGKNTFVNGSGYAATKWGLRAFAQCLMLEERKHGVRVLTVCPGSVATDFGSGNERSPRSAQANIVQPEDVAETILAALRMPQRAMVSEIDIRPTNP
jgi:NADP-dependent 3-hydroxy acid dehydrogenase YdfG